MALVGLNAAADQLQIAREFAVLGDYDTARVYYQGALSQVSRCAVDGRWAPSPRRFQTLETRADRPRPLPRASLPAQHVRLHRSRRCRRSVPKGTPPRRVLSRRPAPPPACLVPRVRTAPAAPPPDERPPTALLPAAEQMARREASSSTSTRHGHRARARARRLLRPAWKRRRRSSRGPRPRSRHPPRALRVEGVSRVAPTLGRSRSNRGSHVGRTRENQPRSRARETRRRPGRVAQPDAARTLPGGGSSTPPAVTVSREAPRVGAKLPRAPTAAAPPVTAPRVRAEPLVGKATVGACPAGPGPVANGRGWSGAP